MKIFLSYGHDENSELIQRIKTDLEGKGHECWIDVAKIKAGDDWRRAITDGIVSSHWVLSFLSRHACRTWYEDGQRKQGVCLDELAIAIGTRGSVVKTILVESPSDPDTLSPPLTVSHIQYLDMHDWRTVKQEGASTFEAWYQDKFADIARILEADENRKLSGEIDKLRVELQPLDNSSRIGELMANGFIGREWLFDEINHWLEHEPQQKVFCLTGEPGYGKSSIAAWLAYQNRPEIIAAHFCQYNQPSFSDPNQLIRSIAFQMATRLPDYRRFLLDKLSVLGAKSGSQTVQQELQALLQSSGGSQVDVKQLEALIARSKSATPTATMTPAELFQVLIVDATNLVIDGGRSRRLVIIDALDEAGAELAEFLAQNQAKLPPWFALFVTSRPNEEAIRPHLTMLNAHYQDIADSRNQADVQAWIVTWLTGRRIVAQEQAAILDPLLDASQGNFHYLRTFRHMVEQDPALLKTPEAYPRGMDSLYFSLFQRQFPDVESYRLWQAPFLRLVAAARQPMPVALARRIAGMNAEQWQINVLSPLGSLFKTFQGRQFASDSVEELMQPFHKSLRDWVSGRDRASRYFVAVEDGHLALADTLWGDFVQGKELNAYGLGELPYHLNQLSDEQLAELIPNLAAWTTSRQRLLASFQTLCDALCYAQAEEGLRLMVRLDASHFGSVAIETAGSLERLANLLRIRGHYGEAEPRLREALAIRENLQGSDNVDTANTLNELAVLLHAKGDYEAAAPLYQRSLDIHERNLGPDDPRTAAAMITLANLREALGDYVDAERLQKGVLAIRQRTCGPKDPALASSLGALGNLLHTMGLYREAEPFCRQALAIREEVLGPEHPDTATSLDNVAALLHASGDFDSSEGLQQRALEVRKRILGPEHPSTATSHNNLGSVLRAKGALDRAEPHCRRALAIWERYLGPEHPKTGTALNNLGMLLHARKDYESADSAYRRALSIWEKSLGLEHPETAGCMDNMAATLRAQRHYVEARELCERSLEIRIKVVGPAHPDTAGSLDNMGRLFKAEGDIGQARSYLTQALAIRREALGMGHPKTISTLSEIEGLGNS